jgi:hypothetical protein
MFADGKTETVAESDSSQDSSGVFNKREIVKDADRFLFDISCSAKEVDQLAEGPRIQIDRERIHSEISTVEISFYRAGLHSGERARPGIVLVSGGSHIDLEAIWKQKHRSPEFFVTPNAAPRKFEGQFSGKWYAISFDHHIDVQILIPQQKISYRPAYKIDLLSSTLRDLACPAQDPDNVGRQKLLHEFPDASAPQTPCRKLFRPSGIAATRKLHVFQEIAPAYYADYLSIPNHGNEPLPALDDQPKNLVNSRIRKNEHYTGAHVVADRQLFQAMMLSLFHHVPMKYSQD